MHQKELEGQSSSQAKTWLGSRECADFLQSCTRLVKRQANKFGLALAEDEAEPGGLWDFVSQKTGLAEQINLLLQEDPSKARMYLASSYLQYLLDLRRQKKDSQFHFLYRKTRDILSQDPGFVLKAGKKGSFFAPHCKQQDLPICTQTLLKESENYQQWPDPQTLSIAGSDKSYILAAAAHFYELACRRLQIQGLLPVRELTAYLMSRTRFQTQEYRVRETSKIQKNDNQEQTVADRPWEELPHPEEYQAQKGLIRSRLKGLAGRMVQDWSPLQARIFYLYYRDELSQSKIANLLGYKGASGVKYQLQLTEQDIRKKTAVWPFLSPPDLDQELFSEFLEEVLEFCKSKNQGR